MRTVWFYLHIPKCGGTTTKSVLRANFGDGFWEDQKLLYHKTPCSPEDLQDLIARHPQARCFAGHRLTARLPRVAGTKIIALTQVRDPASRFLSHYFYHRRAAENSFPETGRLNLEDYFRWAVLDNQAPELINYQTWFLTGRSDRTGAATLGQLMQSDEVMVLPLERFDETLVWLRSAHPQVFGNCYYQIRNRRAPRAEEDPARHRALREAFSAKADLDTALLSAAHAQLDRLLASDVGSQDEVAAGVVRLHAEQRRRQRVRRVMRFARRLLGRGR